MIPPQGLGELSTPDLVSCLTQGMAHAAAKVLEKFIRPPPVSDTTDTALPEWFQQQRAMAPQPPPANMTATSHTSAFDQLGHCRQSPQKGEQWKQCPEMMPRKIERGCQLDRGQEQQPEKMQPIPLPG